MSHYRFYGKPEPVIGGYIVNPESKTIVVYPKGQFPFTYEDLISKNLKRRGILGNTFMWYDPTSEGEEWIFKAPPEKRYDEWIHMKFRGIVYATGWVTFSPNSHIQNCGITESEMRQRVIFDIEDA